jgi:hypothetical protein
MECGIPAYIETCIPDFLRLFAISEEPVKSSPIIPNFINLKPKL